MKRSIALILGICVTLVAPRASADETEATHHGAGPWITIGVGSGVAAIGVLSFVGAARAHADGMTDPEHTMNAIGVVLTATGGAAIVGGILWHFLEHPSPKKAALTIAPTLGGVVLAGQF